MSNPSKAAAAASEYYARERWRAEQNSTNEPAPPVSAEWKELAPETKEKKNANRRKRRREMTAEEVDEESDKRWWRRHRQFSKDSREKHKAQQQSAAAVEEKKLKQEVTRMERQCKFHKKTCECFWCKLLQKARKAYNDF